VIERNLNEFMMKFPLCLGGLLLFSLVSCETLIPGKKTSDRFATTPERAAIQPGLIDEASGIADSRTIEGHLWVHEDSGTPAQLNLLKKDGTLVGRLPLPGIGNRDWEDMAVGPGPQDGVSYLYLGDIGDNTGQNAENYIYRLREPRSASEAVTGIERIAFRYPDGARDAEALMIDPQTRDLWIISKREEKVHLYRLPYPQSTSETRTADYLGELPHSLVTGASISPDGNEILVRTYLAVYHWRRSSGQSVADAMQRTAGRSLAADFEPQGEAICFERNGGGYYTLSERANAQRVTLNFYKRQ